MASASELHPAGAVATPFPPGLAEGDARLATLVQQSLPAMRVTVARASFAPGAATQWHRHDGPQLLVFVDGPGFVETEAADPLEVGAGDTVWCPAGVWHRHGATTTTGAAHVSTTWGDTQWRT
jgi:quercetin dioxygenase-like cupin family protein